MNIFAVSPDPAKCARALDDKRLNKMMLETTQLLCTAINTDAGEQVTPYKNCQPHNPITKWVINRVDMQSWLYALGVAYSVEINHRFGSLHSSAEVLLSLPDIAPGLNMEKLPEFEEYEFYNGARHKKLGIDFTHLPTFKAYKAYLNARWPGDKRKPVWTKRGRPSWCTLP